ncbi:MAG: hypothetical protein BroJett030_09220 [Alphaproteobacteria bacterium]|nr:MAG: hypothetical protein BroJett030_09220 [Alphaproteobacteria bacterium]
MSEDLIRYDILAQEALRGVIRKVLDEVARAGLPGDHHFFITFLTTHPGVRLSKRMRERYPEEMTIVIQHTFWNLEVTDTAFEIDLSFDDIRERLRIPFAAVRGFFDPSVKFGLQFDIAAEPARPTEAPAPKPDKRPPAASVPAVKPQARPIVVKEAPGKAGDKDGAHVVSLDSFRKKK